MKTEKRSGPSTVPCGTPFLIKIGKPNFFLI